MELVAWTVAIGFVVLVGVSGVHEPWLCYSVLAADRARGSALAIEISLHA